MTLPAADARTETATLLLETPVGIEPRRVTADTTIGRDARNAIVVDHPTVSRRHARIYRDAAGWHFEDLGSQNGSTMNEAVPARAAPLGEGVELRIGRVRAWFFAGGVPAGWQPRDADQLAGKLMRCRCGHIGWAPSHTAGMTLACVACGRDVVMRDASTTPQGPAVATDCAACHTTIAAGEPSHACPECGATAHADCWTETRGCATYGCAQAGVLDRGGDGANAEDDAASEDGTRPVQDAAVTSSLAAPLARIVGVTLVGLPTFGVPAIGYGAYLVASGEGDGRGPRRHAWIALAFAAGVVGFAASARWWLGVRG